MRIVLINPKTDTDFPQPPLGLLSIAAVFMEQGHGVRIVDANSSHISLKRLVEEVDLDDIVGITAMSLSYPEAERIARAVRETHPYKTIIIGGVHATVATEEVWETGIYDAVVSGEGETGIPDILNCLSKKEKVKYLCGPAELDEIPPLPYELLESRSKMSYGKHNEFMPILTSRGCPYKCSFCCRIFGNKYRTMSISILCYALFRIHGLGYREIKFYDDVFTLDRARAVEISNIIDNRFMWTCQTRVNLVDKQTLQAMKDGGCYSVSYGIESGDPAILKSISKNVSLEQVEQAVRYSNEVDLRVIGYFMLGSPGETKETIKKTVDYAINLGIDHAQFSIATALPGSELCEYVPEHLRSNAYAMKGVENPSLCELSPKELKKAVKLAEKRFKRGY